MHMHKISSFLYFYGTLMFDYLFDYLMITKFKKSP